MMKQKTLSMMGLLGVAMIAGPLGQAGAQTAAEIKAAIKCRKTIAAVGAGLVKAELGATDGCHKTRDKGKTGVDCNQIAAADLKGKIGPAEGKAAAKIAKACGAADPNGIVLKNYLPGGDVAGNVFPGVRAVVEGSSAGVLGTPGLTGPKAEKAKIKCHGALAAERSKIINEVVKGAIKCQAGQDKLADAASDFASLAADCASLPLNPKHGEKIQKACAPAVGTDGTQVGSCSVLPDCLVTDARAAGETLAAAIFGQPSVCGNGVPEPGESCDDGDLTSGDGCDANCTPTACGNGIVTAGEACDDGNTLNTDACVGQCQLAVCGDGFIETGREQCGDAPADACTTPGELTCQVSQCGPPIGERTARVALVAPAGTLVGAVDVTVDYREDKVRIPGFGDDADSVGKRVTILPAAAGFSARVDRDFRLDVSLVPSVPLASGPIFEIVFDVCTAATIDEYACKVTSAFDGSGNVDITSQVSCTFTLL
jgi:cysteine-rich repeat protein